jgi:hypothetical protein
MAQHDYVIANGTGAAVRSDINGALAAIVSNNSGATEPTTTYAYMPWADTGSSPPVFKIRNAANNGWITLYELDGTFSVEAGSASSPGLYFTGDINTGIFSAGADQFNIATNGVERVEWGTSEVVFNDGGANYDFRIEGDTNSSLFFVDASAEAVGIGTTTPDTIFSVQNVRSDTAGSGWFTYTASATSGKRGLRVDASNGFCFDYYNGSSWSQQAAIDSSGRLLVGTTTPFASDNKLMVEGSGDVSGMVRSTSIANNEQAALVVRGTNSGNSRQQQYGVFKHANITNPCGYLGLICEDANSNLLWVDNSDVLRISTDASHIGTTNGTVIGAQTSDERIKNILGPVEYGLDTLKQIEPVRYSLKSQPDIEQLGFIAQQVQPLVPQSVFDTKEHIEGEPEDAPTKLGMEYVALIPVLVNAIKELSAEVDALKAQLQTS